MLKLYREAGGDREQLLIALIKEAVFIEEELPLRASEFRRAYLRERGMTEPGHGDFGVHLYSHSSDYLCDDVRGLFISVCRYSGRVMTSPVRKGASSRPLSDVGFVPVSMDEEMWAAALAIVFPEIIQS